MERLSREETAFSVMHFTKKASYPRLGIFSHPKFVLPRLSVDPVEANTWHTCFMLLTHPHSSQNRQPQDN